MRASARKALQSGLSDNPLAGDRDNIHGIRIVAFDPFSRVFETLKRQTQRAGPISWQLASSVTPSQSELRAARMTSPSTLGGANAGSAGSEDGWLIFSLQVCQGEKQCPTNLGGACGTVHSAQHDPSAPLRGYGHKDGDDRLPAHVGIIPKQAFVGKGRAHALRIL